MIEPARHLHPVDTNTGELLECHGCAHREDVISGLESEIRSLAAKLTALKRDKEREAREHPLWPTALQVFKVWKIVCGHPRAAWNWQRFEAVRPCLQEKQYGETLETRKMLALRAIVGKQYDCFTVKRRNGTTRRFDEFERIFQSYAYTEECANAAPRDWQDRLLEAVPELVLMEVEAA